MSRRTSSNARAPECWASTVAAVPWSPPGVPTGRTDWQRVIGSSSESLATSSTVCPDRTLGTSGLLLSPPVTGECIPMRTATFCSCWLLLLSWGSTSLPAEPPPVIRDAPPMLSPEQSLQALVPRPGFKEERMAAEPLVMEPGDVAWGPDGKMWGGGRAAYPDPRQPVLVVFGEGNQQHRVNHLRWGLDNWVYAANGDGGAGANGVVKSVRTGETLDIRGRDLRFRPGDGSLDVATGQAQFGRDRDDWGNWFGSNNNDPGWHYALVDHYIRRNPYVAAPPGRLFLSATGTAAPAGG